MFLGTCGIFYGSLVILAVVIQLLSFFVEIGALSLKILSKVGIPQGGSARTLLNLSTY